MKRACKRTRRQKKGNGTWGQTKGRRDRQGDQQGDTGTTWKHTGPVGTDPRGHGDEQGDKQLDTATTWGRASGDRSKLEETILHQELLVFEEAFQLPPHMNLS